jgi:hypothetical protein
MFDSFFAGLQQVQMEWGQAQEPASVLDLATLFPNADVEEVGLYMVSSLHTASYMARLLFKLHDSCIWQGSCT